MYMNNTLSCGFQFIPHTSCIPYLLKWTPRLQFFSGLERCSVNLRVATIQRDAFARVIGSIVLYGYSAKNMVSQVYKAFCFDSIVCGHHVYKRVWTSFRGDSDYHVPCKPFSVVCTMSENVQLSSRVSTP